MAFRLTLLVTIGAFQLGAQDVGSLKGIRAPQPTGLRHLTAYPDVTGTSAVSRGWDQQFQLCQPYHEFESHQLRHYRQRQLSLRLAEVPESPDNCGLRRVQLTPSPNRRMRVFSL